jgi:putative ABC transport system substrate-binding protein
MLLSRHTRRREFIARLGGAALAWPLTARAQVSPRRPLIAVVIGASQAASERWRGGLPQGLEELGRIEGQDYDIEYRYADGDLTRQPAIIDELIRRKPDLIVVGNSIAAIAAKQAAASIPIVFASSFDPIGLGLAASFAHPDKNVTGIFVDYPSLVGKQLELGFELTPGVKRAGMLVNINNTNAAARQGLKNAAQTVAARLISAEIRVSADLDIAFQTLSRERVSTVIALPDPMFLNERRRMAELAIAARLRVVYGLREHVEAGGLMSYGVDLRENWRHVAAYVDKILRGAKPADLPIEHPTKFELVINLKSAKAIGLTIPESFLLRADEVIE